MKYLLAIVAFTVFVYVCYSGITIPGPEDCEPHKVVIKFRLEYKKLISVSNGTSFGLPEFDTTLDKLGTKSVKLRFNFNPQLYKPGLPDLSLIYLVEYEKDIPPQTAADLLMQHKYLQYAEPLFIDEILAVPNDSYYASSTYLSALQAEDAWDIHQGENDTTGIIIAVADTGVKWNHADLAGNIWKNLGEDADGDGSTLFYNGSQWVFDPGDINGIDDDGNGRVDDFIGWDFMLNSSGDESNDPTDGSGHGTTVAGIADARTNNAVGVASIPWNLKLMPLSCTYPGSSSLYKSQDAFIYAAENGAKVLNYSAGSSNFSQVFEDVIAYVNGLGMIVVAAAGNSGGNIILYPAAYPEVVAVASVLNSGEKQPISSYGPFVDVCAPSENVWSTSLGGGYFNSTASYGYTSYASPIGTGLTALIRSAHHDWTNEQVVNQLLASCTEVDSLNPGLENLLGEGMLNAYHALSMLNPQPDQELKLALAELYAPTDANGNHALERDEEFSINLKIRNYAHGVSSNNVTYVLSCSDADITILNNTYNGSLPADGYGYLTNAFQCRVSSTAVTKSVLFNLNISAGLPITSGATQTFRLLINAGGIFVWEGLASAGYSGRRIRDTLISHGYQTFYTYTFPFSFHTFPAVFLSFGMASASSSNVTRFDKTGWYQAVKDYLEEGGRIYIEGNDAIGFDLGYFLPDVGDGQSAAEVLWPLLGIETAEDGSTNGIDGLAGQGLAVTEGLLFTSTSQTKLDYIDKFTPSATGLTAFTESGYGNVAIQNYGSFGQKSFIFSYCLAELDDNAAPSTRDSLIIRIMHDFQAPGNTMQMELPVVTIEKTMGSVDLSWDAVPYANSYRIEASNNLESGFTELETTDQLSYSDTNIQPGRFYRVIARSIGLD